MREHVSVVLSHPVCSNLFQQLQETDTNALEPGTQRMGEEGPQAEGTAMALRRQKLGKFKEPEESLRGPAPPGTSSTWELCLNASHREGRWWQVLGRHMAEPAMEEES